MSARPTTTAIGTTMATTGRDLCDAEVGHSDEGIVTSTCDIPRDVTDSRG